MLIYNLSLKTVILTWNVNNFMNVEVIKKKKKAYILMQSCEKKVKVS